LTIKSPEGWGLADAHTGQIVFPTRARLILYSPDSHWIMVRESAGWAILTAKAERVSSVLYQELEFPDARGVIRAQLSDGKFRLLRLDAASRKLYESESWDAIRALDQGYFEVKHQAYAGVLDSLLKPVLKPEYQAVRRLHGLGWSARNQTGWLIFDPTGKLLAEGGFDSLRFTPTGTLIARRQGKWKLGTAHNPITQQTPMYDEVIESAFGLAHSANEVYFVRNGNSWGVVTRTNRQLLPCSYQRLTRESEHFIFAYTQRLAPEVVCSTTGSVVDASMFDQVKVDITGRLIVESNSRFNLLSLRGSLVFPEFYPELISALEWTGFDLSTDQGLYLFRQDSLWGCWQVHDNPDGQLQARPHLQPRYVNLKVFNDQLYAAFQPNEGWKLFKYPNTLLDLRPADEIRLFDNRIIVLTKEDKNQLLTLAGKLIHKGQLITGLDTLNEGYYQAVIDPRTEGRIVRGFVFDTLGRVLMNRIIERYEPLSEPYARYYQSGRWGLVDTLDRVLISPEFNSIQEVGPGLFLASKGQLMGLFCPALGWQSGVEYKELRSEEGHWYGFKQQQRIPVDVPTLSTWVPQVAGRTDAGVRKQSALASVYPLDWVSFGDAQGYTRWKLVDPTTLNEHPLWRRGRHSNPKISTDDYPVRFQLIPGLPNHVVYASEVGRQALLGVVNSGTGEVVSEPAFTEIFIEDWAAANWARVRYPNKEYGILHRDGQNIRLPGIIELGPVRGNLAAAQTSARTWGYLNTKGEWVIRPQFARAEPFSHATALVAWPQSSQGKPTSSLNWGVLDTLGKIKIPLEHAHIERIGAYFMVSAACTKYVVVNDYGLGNQELTIDASAPEPLDSGLYRVRRQGRFGAISSAGQWVIPPQYDDIAGCRNGYCRVMLNQRWGLYHLEHQEVLRTIFPRLVGTTVSGGCYVLKDSVWMFFEPTTRAFSSYSGTATIQDVKHVSADGYALVQLREGRKVFLAYLDPRMRRLPTPDLMRAHPFVRGYAVAKDGFGKWGVLNRTGRWTINPQWTGIEQTENEYFIVKEKDSYGLRKAGDLEILPAKFEKVRQLGSSPYWIAKRPDGWSLFNASGQELTDQRYRQFFPPSEGYIRAEKETGEWIFLDSLGHPLLKRTFLKARDVHNLYARVSYRKKNGTLAYGFWSPAGRPYLPLKGSEFAGAQDVSHNYTLTNNGYLDVTRRKLLRVKGLSSFLDQLAIASPLANGSGVGLIDTAGRWVVPSVYGQLAPLRGHRLLQYRLPGQARWGILNPHAGSMVLPRFTRLTALAPGHWLGEQTSTYLLLNSQGQQVVKNIDAYAILEGGWLQLDINGYSGWHRLGSKQWIAEPELLAHIHQNRD
jgi:hypothetical protein